MGYVTSQTIYADALAVDLRVVIVTKEIVKDRAMVAYATNMAAFVKLHMLILYKTYHILLS